MLDVEHSSYNKRVYGLQIAVKTISIFIFTCFYAIRYEDNNEILSLKYILVNAQK